MTLPPSPLPTLLLPIALLVALLSPLLPVGATFIDNISYPSLLPYLPTHHTLLFITVRWCEHCRSLAPELSHLARSAAPLESMLLARSDADDHPGLAAAFAVRGYPTILYVPPAAADAAPTAAREFSDYRWAELIAEFVNNETASDLLPIQPRDAFLRWRRTTPHNLGTSGPRAAQHAAPPDGLLSLEPEDEHSTLGIREPLRLFARDFDTSVLVDRATRFMVLFYAKDDPMLRELLIEWRQASSAFTGADNVTVALVNVSERDSHPLLAFFHITQTPRCLFFPSCESDASLPECKSPVVCDADMYDTENIVQFLSDRVLEEMGFKPDEGHPGASKSYHLTEEEYQRMKGEGSVFANDLDQEEQVRQLYQHNSKRGVDGFTVDEKEEL